MTVASCSWVRRVKGVRGVVVVSYSKEKRVGTFMSAEGRMSIAGSWGWVAQLARQYGVPEVSGK